MAGNPTSKSFFMKKIKHKKPIPKQNLRSRKSYTKATENGLLKTFKKTVKQLKNNSEQILGKNSKNLFKYCQIKRCLYCYKELYIKNSCVKITK